MKIIFLDVDGVLNCQMDFQVKSIYFRKKDMLLWFKKLLRLCHIPLPRILRRQSMYVLNKKMVKRLHKIVGATGAKIVVSSTWRRFKHNLVYLQENGVDYIDITPIFNTPPSERYGQRGAEIQEWIDKHKEMNIEKYVIIDDGWDFLDYQRPFYVETQWLNGLQDKHVKQAIKMLS